MVETGIVHKVDSKSGWVVVRFDRKLACENCNMCLKPREENYVEIKVKNTLNAKIKDRVVISMGAKAVLAASFLVYILPLVFVGIVLLATYKLNNEWLSLGLGLGTLVLSFVALAVVDKQIRKKKGFFPEMLEIIHEDVPNKDTIATSEDGEPCNNDWGQCGSSEPCDNNSTQYTDNNK